MSAVRGPELVVAAPPLPRSIWVVAWASLAGQLVLLADQGVNLSNDGVGVVLSVVIGGLLVGYVSAGVVRARTVRTVIAWVVLVITLLFELISLVTADGFRDAILLVLSAATSVVALVGLARFRRTGWYAWQRTKPSARDGAPIGQLVAIGVIVGVLGGIAGPVEDGLRARITVAPHTSAQQAPPAIALSR